MNLQRRCGPPRKLSDEQVVEIFCSPEPRKVLAARFGVATTTISQIQLRKARRNVTAELNRIGV